MKIRTLLIGALTTAAALAGGWALAKSSGSGPLFLLRQGPDGTGPGMMGGMRHGHGMGPGMMQGRGPGMGHGPGKHNGKATRMTGGTFEDALDPTEIDSIRSELGITASQEPAWNKYAKALQEATAVIEPGRNGSGPSDVSGMTPAERFAFVSRLREQRQKQLDMVRTAAAELFAVLDSGQKAIADDLLAELASGLGSMRDPVATGRTHKH